MFLTEAGTVIVASSPGDTKFWVFFFNFINNVLFICIPHYWLWFLDVSEQSFENPKVSSPVLEMQV